MWAFRHKRQWNYWGLSHPALPILHSGSQHWKKLRVQHKRKLVKWLTNCSPAGSGQWGSNEDALANLKMASDDDDKAGSNEVFLELGWL
jgi:hypothetical protein